MLFGCLWGSCFGNGLHSPGTQWGSTSVFSLPPLPEAKEAPAASALSEHSLGVCPRWGSGTCAAPRLPVQALSSALGPAVPSWKSDRKEVYLQECGVGQRVGGGAEPGGGCGEGAGDKPEGWPPSRPVLLPRLSSGLSSVLPLPSWPGVFFFNCKHLLRSQASDRSRSLGAWC